MKIAVDLLWLRPSKVGGTESYIRNLLEGFCQLEEDFELVLLLSKDNEQTFRNYLQDPRFTKIICNIKSANIAKRIIWQNLIQNSLMRKYKIYHCFTPVYCRPIFNGRIEYINTIHDIQAYHYPQYHPIHEVLYSKLCWLVDKKKSKKIIAISNFVKEDLIKIYKIPETKIEVIYNPILIKKEMESIEYLKEKHGIKDKQYYYTVSQLIPHKNLETLIRVFAQIKYRKINLPCKLIISGVTGNATEQVEELISKFDLKNEIVLTGYVQDGERNALYKYCKGFLFPSIFEGFGMPPVEAMIFGVPVVTTRCASIFEVTQGKANYVENPYDIEEWIETMLNMKNESLSLDIDYYNQTKLAKKYLEILKDTFSEEN